ncbi:sugar ABC transporter ATP-binding protein [Labrys wisconsinensis]|uniref:Simple sugar transport system ATP-binding protein n=1 Tax=Labrys wisconsinensis TaxID=425677 RepID=A0ABU0JLZ5_9HYPH|nr:sugar ABC transporter ATP-binding protein [Labrys wisconsinensis]MDQ0475316.1 simple sugar transport system ATP-binding protein [Labrys wisconsinensis]
MTAIVTRELPAAQPGADIVEVRAVSKSFGPTRALVNVSMTIAEGEVRALLGRNGAGKSTLISLLTGLQTPDEGEVRVMGVPATAATGVACVYQHSRLVPALTVAENIMMGHYPRRFGAIAWRRVAAEAEERLAPWELSSIAARPVESLDPVQTKVVEICRALSRNPRVLLLDEPTAGLDRRDAERLFGFIDRLKERGVTLVFVSHHLDEVYRVCASATVLRDARHIVTAPLGDLPKQALIHAMVGEHAPPGEARGACAGAERADGGPGTSPGLSVRGLSVPGVLEDVAFDVGRGECVGIAGLEGSGKGAIGAVIAGLLAPSSGSVEVSGRRYRLGDVRSAIRAGVGYVPQNRNIQGMVKLLSVSENATMTATRRLARPLIPGLLGILLKRDRDAVYRRLARQWQIVASSPDQPIGELSGGNQQKCVMARGIASDPDVLVLQNPTAGIDIAAKASITQSMAAILRRGASILVISEDADDFALCSRILVVNKGRLAAELSSSWTERDLVSAMQGAQ